MSARYIGRANVRKLLEPLEGTAGRTVYADGDDDDRGAARRDADVRAGARRRRTTRCTSGRVLEAIAEDHLVAVLLVRLGGYAVGTFDGEQLVTSKVGSRFVKNRHKKGGSSSNRFRRRREEQAKALIEEAADVAAAVLTPTPFSALGGDRSAVDGVLAAKRELAWLRERAIPHFLTVPEPRLRVLEALPYDLYAVARRGAWRVTTTHRYGEHRDQFCELAGGGGPTAVLLHGGFWRAKYECDLMRPMAADLSARGWATWNVEYRRVGAGGGYPATLEDVSAACRAADELGLGPLVAIGHSAGGHLALWLASERLSRQRSRSPASRASPTPSSTASGTTPRSSSWGRRRPSHRRPTRTPIRCSGCRRACRRSSSTARATTSSRSANRGRMRTAPRRPATTASCVEFRGGHFSVIEPSSDVWPTIADRLESLRPKLPA